MCSTKSKLMSSAAKTVVSDSISCIATLLSEDDWAFGSHRWLWMEAARGMSKGTTGRNILSAEMPSM